MPTYQYRCTECGHAFEEFQSFTDDALTVCPVCGGRLRKVFNAVGVVFKGSGFYRNDSRTRGAPRRRLVVLEVLVDVVRLVRLADVVRLRLRRPTRARARPIRPRASSSGSSSSAPRRPAESSPAPPGPRPPSGRLWRGSADRRRATPTVGGCLAPPTLPPPGRPACARCAAPCAAAVLARRRPLAAACAARRGRWPACTPPGRRRRRPVAVPVAAHDLGSGTVLSAGDLVTPPLPGRRRSRRARWPTPVGRTLAAPVRAGRAGDRRPAGRAVAGRGLSRAGSPCRCGSPTPTPSALLRVGDHVDLVAADPRARHGVVRRGRRARCSRCPTPPTTRPREQPADGAAGRRRGRARRRRPASRAPRRPTSSASCISR